MRPTKSIPVTRPSFKVNLDWIWTAAEVILSGSIITIILYLIFSFKA